MSYSPIRYRGDLTGMVVW